MNVRVPRKKPFINKENKVLLLKYAKEFINKDNSLLSTILFSDESKFDVFGKYGCKIVWETKNRELNRKNQWPTVQYW